MAVVALPACQGPLVQRRAACGRSRLQRRALAARAEATNSATTAPAEATNGAAATAVVEETKERKPGPLERGGTLQGAAAAGKDASDKFRSKAEGGEEQGAVLQIVDGRFRDYRWSGGRWDLSLFKKADGEMDWDKVIDAEMARRKLLEDSPIPSITEEAVVFDTSEIPWWAWVRRFHLPEAEKLNGRAAMVGYFLALVVDKLTGGVPLLEQQDSFLGKLVLHITVFGVLLFRSSSDIEKYKNLLDEATFYDRQWDATWDGVERPSEKEGRA